MLKLFNSLTKTLENFEPREKDRVRIFTCGPSIYQLPHIGNYRTFVFEDILQRYLKYLGYSVERVLGITDLEDKAIVEAEKQDIPLKELTDGNIEIFLKELKSLRAKIPDYLPRSSTTISQAVSLIEILIEKGYAYKYIHEGRQNIYYDPLKFDGFGKLFGLDMTKWPQKKRRFHKDTYPGSRWNRGDFILWHGYKKGDKIYWDTKIGKGRPSWNIQDPAMIPQKFDYTIDIWCSGIDSTYRHHDYIIAVVEAVTGRPHVRYWLHAAHLFFEGEKMSKSKGNIEYPRDLLAAECIWDHIRFFFIYGHYRQKMNFTFKKYNQVCNQLKSFRELVNKLSITESVNQKSCLEAKRFVKKITEDFEKNMNNDLQVKDAFDSLYKIVSKLVKHKEKHQLNAEDSKKALEKLQAVDHVLQIIF